MAAEDIFELLDSYWFEHGIFTRKSLSSPKQADPVLEIQQKVQKPKISRLPTLQVRSLSDHALSCKTSFTTDCMSPDSIPTTPKLETVLSGKEVLEFSSDENIKLQEEKEVQVEMPLKARVSERRKRRKKESSKSLSELEFEELKGFMDLGFVFSEEDQDYSSLVSIIPGLQRLKQNSAEINGNEEECINKSMVSRPYLSEAWDVLGQRKMENRLMNWRIPALTNEVNMKDHLRFWAHTVASTVR